MKTQRRMILSTQFLRIAAVAVIFICLNVSGVCQTGNLSGVVNKYAKVTSAGANSVTVSSATGFSAGDHVLIIQMNGAVINTANAPGYGAIADYHSAGSYEIATIASVQGTVVTLKNNLINEYDPSQAVQLVRVPSYSDASVSGTITAQPWNGSTGGVAAIIASGTLTLNADIDVSGAGFRGGATDNVYRPNGTNRTCDSSDYFFTSTGISSASKGEGITLPATQSGNPIGKGASANAGGGANTEEGGGGGGGNYGTGGNGGANSGSQQCTNIEGLGGNGLLYSNAFGHIYMGGGGGGGHTDDNGGVGGIGTPGTGGAGASGGGIVIIQAGTIAGNNHTIRANGGNAANAEEGTGGGGAGGTILLDASTYISAVNVQMNGGIGGSNQNDESTDEFYECSGSGGGGAGGVLWVSNPKVDPNVRYSIAGGAAGAANGAGDCSGSVGDPGQPGGVLTKLVIPESSPDTATICVTVVPAAASPSVPVVASVYLSDSMSAFTDSITFDMLYQASALAFDATTLDGCAVKTMLAAPGVLHVTLTACPAPLKPGILFSAVFEAVVTANDTAQTAITVSNIRTYPPQALQLSGCSIPLTVLPPCGLEHGALYTGASSSMAPNYPNPFTGKTTIPVSLSKSDAGLAQLRVYNILGAQVADLSARANGDNSEIIFDGGGLPAGMYACVLQTPAIKITRQLFVVH